MSKRKPIDKAQARERRDRLMESAAAAELSLTEGVREMRAISGMTQEEFAEHRGVSARVIKAIELGQGNPTVATLNRIGQFFGLEVAFVPIERAAVANNRSSPETVIADHGESVQTAWEAALLGRLEQMDRKLENLFSESLIFTKEEYARQQDSGSDKIPSAKKKS